MLVLTLLFGYFIDSSMIKSRRKINIFEHRLRQKLNEKAITMKFEYTEEPDALDKLQTARESVRLWDEGMVEALYETFTFISLASPNADIP